MPLRRVLDGLYGLCVVLAAVCLAVIALITLASVVGRLLGLVVPSANAIGGYLVAATTFLALAPTLRSGGHIRVELFVSRLGERIRHWVEIWCLAVATALVGYLAYSSVELVMSSYHFGTTSPGLLPIPIWIPQSALVLGLAVMTLALLELLFGALAGRTPCYNETADAPGPVASDENSAP